jgi:hypothetical protein
VQFVAKLLTTERHRRKTPKGSRALTCFWQAVLGLRWFRDRTTQEALAPDTRSLRCLGERGFALHRALARSAAHHRHPFQDRGQHAGSPRPDAFRTWLHHFK